MKKRWMMAVFAVIFCVLCFALSTGVSQTVFAVETVPGGYKAIRTETDLLNIANNMSGKYILMNDITLSDRWSFTDV